jgi:hypothetical protein
MEILNLKTSDEAIKWLQETKLMRTNPPKCDNKDHKKPINLKLQKTTAIKDGIKFRCSKCGRSKSIRYESYFAEIKIELLSFLKLLFYWALEVRQTDISKILKIAANTISKYFQTIRALCFL